MNVNDKAPDFTLQDENGKEVSLKDLRGKTVVLYFFPRADTPGWTIEAREFRDRYKKIQKAGAVVFGVSPDTPQAQKKFQDKYSLPFSLLPHSWLGQTARSSTSLPRWSRKAMARRCWRIWKTRWLRLIAEAEFGRRKLESNRAKTTFFGELLL
jgi:AhpC/TSA family